MRFIEILVGLSPDNNTGMTELAIILAPCAAVMTVWYFSCRAKPFKALTANYSVVAAIRGRVQGGGCSRSNSPLNLAGYKQMPSRKLANSYLPPGRKEQSRGKETKRAGK